MMLCDIVENGKGKCSQYWPEPKSPMLKAGEFTVSLSGVLSIMVD